MSGWGGDLQGSPSPAAAPAQDTPTITPFARERCSNLPELWQAGAVTLPWGAVPVPSSGEKPFPDIQPQPALAQLWAFPSGPVAGHREIRIFYVSVATQSSKENCMYFLFLTRTSSLLIIQASMLVFYFSLRKS